MIKPIFLVGLPLYTNLNEVYQIQKNIEDKMKEYYVLVYRCNNCNPEFKCFYEKDLNVVKYEELKKYVYDLINK